MTASGQHPIFHLRMYGPQAAVFAESFTGRLRYSGSSLGCHLACLIAGGSAPLIAAWLLSEFNSLYAIAGYISICAATGEVTREAAVEAFAKSWRHE